MKRLGEIVSGAVHLVFFLMGATVRLDSVKHPEVLMILSRLFFLGFVIRVFVDILKKLSNLLAW